MKLSSLPNNDRKALLTCGVGKGVDENFAYPLRVVRKWGETGCKENWGNPYRKQSNHGKSPSWARKQVNHKREGRCQVLRQPQKCWKEPINSSPTTFRGENKLEKGGRRKEKNAPSAIPSCSPKSRFVGSST